MRAPDDTAPPVEDRASDSGQVIHGGGPVPTGQPYDATSNAAVGPWVKMPEVNIAGSDGPAPWQQV